MTSDSNQVKLTFIGSYNLLNSREFLSAYVHSAFWHIRPISPEARLDKLFSRCQADPDRVLGTALGIYRCESALNSPPLCIGYW